MRMRKDSDKSKQKMKRDVDKSRKMKKDIETQFKMRTGIIIQPSQKFKCKFFTNFIC